MATLCGMKPKMGSLIVRQGVAMESCSPTEREGALNDCQKKSEGSLKLLHKESESQFRAAHHSTQLPSRPFSRIQAETDPSMAESTPPVSPAQGDSTPPNTQAPGGSVPFANQSTLPPTNRRYEYDCGCADIYDHTGKKRQLACDLHRLNPNRSVHPLPPKMPLGKATNLTGGGPRLSSYTPQPIREPSPPRRPPVETPTKGRNFVQGSENGPGFLDSFNSDRAIEPTGPPNTLTTIPTQENEFLKKSERTKVPRPLGPPNCQSHGTAPNQGTSPTAQIPPSDQNNDDAPLDNHGGVRLFQDTVGRLRAGGGSSAVNDGTSRGPNPEDQGGVPVPTPPTLVLERGAGIVGARTDSNGAPVFAAPPGEAGNDSSSRDEGTTCNPFILMWRFLKEPWVSPSWGWERGL